MTIFMAKKVIMRKEKTGGKTKAKKEKNMAEKEKEKKKKTEEFFLKTKKHDYKKEFSNKRVFTPTWLQLLSQ